MKKNLGKLTLIPTSLNEDSPLDENAIKVLKTHLSTNSILILVESHKISRRRWINSGLPRERIDDFILFNKKTEVQEIPNIIEKLNQGFQVFMMSDSGVPGFCDPGTQLIARCHQENIPVTCIPISNSIIQAIALSGLNMNQFHFAGFPPTRGDDRLKFLKRVCQNPQSSVMMDTPYRLNQLVNEISNISSNRKIFLALDLNLDSEKLYLDFPKEILRYIKNQKAEFILIIEADKKFSGGESERRP